MSNSGHRYYPEPSSSELMSLTPGGAVITWSWNGRLVSAGAMRVYTDDRIVVREDGRDLVVREVSLEDRGEWSCTVQLKQEPVSLAHRLEILVAPSISLDHSAVSSEVMMTAS